MKESMELKVHFNISPEQLFDAWLDSTTHSEMTQSIAICSNEPGGTFDIWEGYITGTNLDIVANKEILQSWRTSEFNDSDEDSVLHLFFEANGNGTDLILNHSNIPEGQTQYVKGWDDNYFKPMKAYFKSLLTS